MALADSISAPELGEDEVLLPVRVAESAALVLTEGVAGSRVGDSLERKSLGHIRQPFIIVVSRPAGEPPLAR